MTPRHTKAQLEAEYKRLKGKKLIVEDDLANGILFQDVMKHRLGLPVSSVYPYFDYDALVGPGDGTVEGEALDGKHTIDDLIKLFIKRGKEWAKLVKNV